MNQTGSKPLALDADARQRTLSPHDQRGPRGLRTIRPPNVAGLAAPLLTDAPCPGTTPGDPLPTPTPDEGAMAPPAPRRLGWPAVGESGGIIVLGELVADIAPEIRNGRDGLALRAHAGGSPANVAVGLARLGVPTAFAGRFSRVGLGPFLRAHLERSGVDLTPSVDAAEPATLAIVSFEASGSAAYEFYVEGTADWRWSPPELPRNAGCSAIHTGSIAIGIEPGADAIAEWVATQSARGAFVSLDPNVRPALVLGRPGYLERLEALVDCANLVKASDDDLAALHPGVAPLDTAARWAARGPELVVVTHGAQGSTAIRAGAAPVHAPAVPVEIVDTIGAGDSFAAGLLAYLAEHDRLRAGGCVSLTDAELADALAFAGRVAAIACSRAGADPPRRSELDAA